MFFRRTLKAGDIAPDFRLPDHDGSLMSLVELLEKGILVLFFYPKDDSPGCTRQACSFRDNYGSLLELGAEVAGVSRDPQSGHVSFKGKYDLPYSLLSDTGGEVHRKYGVMGRFGLIPRRVTFVIDREKKILLRHEDNLRMNSHVQAVIKALKT